MINRLDVEGRLVCLVVVVELELRWIGAFEFVYCLLNMRLESGELLPRLFQLGGGNKLRWPIRGDNGGPVRGSTITFKSGFVDAANTSWRVKL